MDKILIDSSKPMLSDKFAEYRKSRVEFETIKEHLTGKIRRFEQEKIAAELKKGIVTEMLKQGDFINMSTMPDAFFTETTESDARYSFLAEAAVIAAEYFKAQGFDVDVRWDSPDDTRQYGKKKQSRAGIFFIWHKKGSAQPTGVKNEKPTKK